MLKGRGKVVKPSFKPRPRPPPSSSSARPSTEPQTQAAAPSLTQAQVSGANATNGSLLSTAVDTTPSIEPSHEISNDEAASGSIGGQNIRAIVPTNNASTKRKNPEEELPTPRAKRLHSGLEERSSLIPGGQPATMIPPTTQDESSPSLTSQSTKPTPKAPPRRARQISPIIRPGSPTRGGDVLGSPEGRLVTSSAHSPGERQINTNGNLDKEGKTSHSLGGVQSSEVPQYQYPSPENIVSIAEDAAVESANTISMGPAGGATSSGRRAGSDTATGASQNAQISEIVPMAALNPDGTSGGIIEEVAAGTGTGKKKGRKPAAKRRMVQDPEEEVDGRTTVEIQLNRPRRAAGARRSRKKKNDEKEKRKRAETPEDAEEEEIDPATITMAELCKDLRIGKKFSMHDEIRQRLQTKKTDAIKEKMIIADPSVADQLPGSEAQANQEDTAEPGETATDEVANSEEVVAPAPSAGIQMRVVDGQLVIDENALQLDRHAVAKANGPEFTVVEENEFTRVFTSGTHMKRETSSPWDGPSTKMFYYGLTQFGTDFESIAALFPHRNRRQIKLKFNKEERENGAKIDKYLTAPRKPIDIAEFERLSGLKLEEKDDIYAEQARIDAEQEAEIARHQAEQAEVIRKKKESIHKSSAAARAILDGEASDGEINGREASAAPAKQKRVPKKKKKLPPGGDIVSVEPADHVLQSIERD